jgi:ABC-type phosphate transport system substrate-binding protein
MISRTKFYDNESAVSVLVGTLALIAVVIAGTMGIAMIVGSFSTDVSKQASPDQSIAATQTPVYIGGSDNMNGLTRSLATLYNKGNPSLRIETGSMDQTGLDDALTKKRIDIGAFSGEAGYAGYATLASDPTITMTQIGMSSVVVITNKITPGVSGTVQYSDLYNFFNPPGVAGGNIHLIAIRAVRSDQPETTTKAFYSFLGLAVPGSGSGNVIGKDAMIQFVATTPESIGYADYSDAETAIQNGMNIAIVGITDPPPGPAYLASSITYTNLAIADKNKYRSIFDNSKYNQTLCYPLYYVTTENTAGSTESFINFVKSPAARSAFQNVYTVSIADL